MTIGIVGAGAAGLIAAATIKEMTPTANIIVFEKNLKIGRKIAISGGGRCNVTTGITDIPLLLNQYPRGGKFLKFAFKNFPPQKVINWFNTQGVLLKCEEDMRVFPVSDNAEAVNDLFYKLIKNSLYVKEQVLNIEKVEQNNLTKFKITTSNRSTVVDKLILTTGGNAYSHTGSTGDGYKFSQNLGHTITKLGPSLTSFLTKEDWIKNLQGVSLKEIELSLDLDQTKIPHTHVKLTGEILFTHFGITGPVVFKASSHLAFSEISPQLPKSIKLRFLKLPNKLALNSLLELHGKKTVLNALATLFPNKVSRTILEQGTVQLDLKSAELSKENRNKLSEIFTNGLLITLTNRRPGDEFVTAGGIKLEEVSSKTMESKIIPNLFFAGEILDIDGYTGGFNLQASWATGRLAGLSASKPQAK